MGQVKELLNLSTTSLSDVLTKDSVMSINVRGLWQNIPRIAGPAFTVKCQSGDNLMLHAAIHRAPKGSILVVESEDCDYAVCGGNVCAVAKKNGIEGFIVDGAIRDLKEDRSIQFPIFARGVIPIPGGKEFLNTLNDKPVVCGGITVHPGDFVVADEEGIVVIPAKKVDEIIVKAKAKSLKDSEQTLEQWEIAHRNKIEDILRKKGFQE